MEPVQIHVSPRRMCECGKTILQLSVEEKKIYDEMIRLSEERTRKAKEEVTGPCLSSTCQEYRARCVDIVAAQS